MECRQISAAEVEEIMLEGKINYSKSDLKNTRCPRYALEGVTDDEQRVRIVYAQCNTKTTVVTVIDLEREWSCDCPGDDDKFKKQELMKGLLKPLQWIYSIYALVLFVAIMLVIFPFVIIASFFRPHQRRQYDPATLYAMGRSLVPPDLYLE